MPNFHQAKDFHCKRLVLRAERKSCGARVRLFNDADVMAGNPAAQGKLHELTRCGRSECVGFGRYPSSEGIWEGGTPSDSDPKENFCGCGVAGTWKNSRTPVYAFALPDLEPKKFLKTPAR